MRSAYVVANGVEPDFTNNAIIKDLPQFTETLDYIFISEHWNVDSVLQIPRRKRNDEDFITNTSTKTITSYDVINDDFLR